MKLFDQAAPNPKGYKDVSCAQVNASLGNQVRFVDVREPHEYNAELGHIAQAKLVPLATVVQASHEWEPNEEIVLICRSGGRSGRAAEELAALGFTKVMNMVGGMIAYKQAGYPVSQE